MFFLVTDTAEKEETRLYNTTSCWDWITMILQVELQMNHSSKHNNSIEYVYM